MISGDACLEEDGTLRETNRVSQLKQLLIVTRLEPSNFSN